MIIRRLVVLILLIACSSCGQNESQTVNESQTIEESRTIELSATRLAEIKSKPYVGGNGPGGFATARLSGMADPARPEGIEFTGFGPYLHDLGFAQDMMITAINGQGVHEIFADRWQGLRLNAPDAFDAAHYEDLIKYLFDKAPGESIVITLDVDVSTADINDGTYKQKLENWRINLLR